MSEIRTPPTAPDTPTPTAAYEPYAAGVLIEMGIEPYMSGGKWRFEIDEVQMMALVTRVYGDGKERGEVAGGAAFAEEIRARVNRIWPDPMGQWSAEQAAAAVAVKEAVRHALDAVDAPDPDVVEDAIRDAQDRQYRGMP